MNAFPKSRLKGFSLVELMAGVVVMSIVTALAIPSYNLWIQGVQIRTAAESIQDGLQKARAEAVARNTNVAFVLGAADSSWVVSVVAGGAAIESRLANEGSKNVTRAVLPLGATTITFNNFGGVVTNAPDAFGVVTPTLTQIDLDSSRLTPADRKSLRITIGAGGVGSNVRMCDPNMPSGTSARAC